MVFLPTFVPQIFGALSKNIHEVLVQPLFVSLKDFEVFGGTGFLQTWGIASFLAQLCHCDVKLHFKPTRTYNISKKLGNTKQRNTNVPSIQPT